MSPEIDDRVDLKRAIRDLHGVEADWEATYPVKETFRGRVIWDAEVQVFRLLDHPQAARCYAWSHALDGTTRRRYFAVLELGPVDSARKAVQAAIVGQ